MMFAIMATNVKLNFGRLRVKSSEEGEGGSEHALTLVDLRRGLQGRRRVLTKELDEMCSRNRIKEACTTKMMLMMRRAMFKLKETLLNA